MTVQVNRPGAKISDTMYGIFFEDINYAADGGLYAEMVKNRSFEFPYALTGWTPTGPNSEGAEFDYLWPEMRRLQVDLVDEHFYRPENGFFPKECAMTGIPVKARRYSPVSMPAMPRERNTIIFTLRCWRLRS